MPKRKLKPKASGQWKLYQSTKRNPTKGPTNLSRETKEGTMSIIIQKKPHKRPISAIKHDFFHVILDQRKGPQLCSVLTPSRTTI